MDLTIANTNWLNPLWPQGTTALKYYCCSTQTIILLSQWKISFPRIYSVSQLEIQALHWKKGKKKNSDSIEKHVTLTWDHTKGYFCSSNKNCWKVYAECKDYNTIRCEILTNQLSIKKSTNDWYNMHIISGKSPTSSSMGCFYNTVNKVLGHH